MRIICLDRPSFLPREWRDAFATLGEFQVFEDHPDPETALRRLRDADLAVVEATPLPGELLRQVTRLRYITLATNGFHGVDLDAAGAAGITVAHCPDHSRVAVAEYVFRLLFEVTRGGRVLPGRELRGRTLGLLGTGRIGGHVAGIAAGFGMRVVGANRRGTPVPGVSVVPLEELLREADVLSVHLPLDGDTRGILNAERLALLRPSAVIVNTSRGELIDQAAMARLLVTGGLAGAGLDHITDDAADTLRALDNVVLTPGTAWDTETARADNPREIFDNLTSYLAGRPQHVLTDGTAENPAA
ncbi:2-hydroxyacid dehydrogenase [Nocardia macrotermitis]|uniref:Glycerate dehydrogenase n=1 Tax=Nocardia macrotermitis TaxID=2585198 RepID=A0A7K0D993_9NOCA|nr:NAD(P)-dependent oxidoreductase [Nocardia macrotermitis]MQY22297.1 Glycerate dehydrogenase [Nocardia macrotermitis]